MVEKEDNFNEFLKQKVEESHFEFNEAYWLKAEKLIVNSQPKRKPFWWGFGLGVLSIVLIGGLTAVIINNGNKNVIADATPQFAKATLVNEVATVLVGEQNTADLIQEPEINWSSQTEVLALYVQHKSTLAAKALPQAVTKANAKQINFSAKSNIRNTSVNSKDANLTASTSGFSEGNFSQVKSLSVPKLPESFVNETDEENDDENVVITIAEPIIFHANVSSIKDIDVNVVAACENQNKHEWMFGVLAGISDSRGFEGNTVSTSKIGFGYFGGIKLAYKIDKNWFVAAQPLIYSRGAINTSIETEKTAYDFGSNADEFVVKNKALVFSELPISIGYRIQRHQISLGAGIEYLVNVKSDVKGFGTDTYTPNQWGYTAGFNRVGAMAIFNYSFKVYNEFWITMMVQKGFTDMTKTDYFTTNSKDKNLNLRIGIQYLLNNQKKKGK